MRDIENANDQYIIFASDAPPEITKQLLSTMKVNFKPLMGRYKEVNEPSFIINKKDLHLIGQLIENQESIMELTTIKDNGLRHAMLIFKNGTHAPLGYMHEVTKEQAEKSIAFTYDPATNIYYIAE